jgi:hypothetical protein
MGNAGLYGRQNASWNSENPGMDKNESSRAAQYRKA